jgi:hypothetical protein
VAECHKFAPPGHHQVGLVEMRKRNNLKERQLDSHTVNALQHTHAGRAQTNAGFLRVGGGQQFRAVLCAGNGADTPKTRRPCENGLQSLAQRSAAFHETAANLG